MSHDDPGAKDATKKPPDGGDRSFLRIGSFPSLARMGARCAAFSGAAAVLLGGSRALADDGVFVHIDSPVPAQIAEYSHHDGRFGWSETRPVCGSPCDRRIDLFANQRYVITGAFPDPSAFSLPDVTGGVTITVQPGSYRRRTAGFWATLCGVIAFLPGVVLLSVGRAAPNPPPLPNPLPAIGTTLMVAGGVGAIPGVVLLATSGTKIKLQKTGVGPLGIAAPVKPRYWMGEF